MDEETLKLLIQLNRDHKVLMQCQQATRDHALASGQSKEKPIVLQRVSLGLCAIIKDV